MKCLRNHDVQLLVAAVLVGCTAQRNTLAVNVTDISPFRDAFDLFVDSLLHDRDSSVLCAGEPRSSKWSKINPADPVVLIKVTPLSWRVTIEAGTLLSQASVYLAALVEDTLLSEMRVMLFTVYSRDQAVGGWTSWRIIPGAWGNTTIHCLNFPADGDDRAYIPSHWAARARSDSTAAGGSVISMNRDAWLAYLGFAPPFDPKDYIDPDNIRYHP